MLNGGVTKSSGFALGVARPVDYKYKAASIAERNATPLPYEGMLVYVDRNDTDGDASGQVYKLLPLDPAWTEAYGTADEHWEAIGGGAQTATSYTHADLLALKNTGELKVGGYYTITDFATKHIIPNTTTAVNTGASETITLTAITASSFSPWVISAQNPNDDIRYDITNVLCEDGTTARKGFITYRKDNTYNIEAYFDWKNHKFRRWKINPDAYSAATTYAANAVVLYSNTVWVCITAGTVGVTPGTDKTKWMYLYDLVGWASYGAIDWWVATHPTSFKIGNYTVPVDSTNYADYYAICRITGTDTRNSTMNLASGVFSNISIGKCTTSPNLYNNIVMAIGNTTFGFVCRNVTFAGECSNMTFGFNMDGVRYFTGSSDNLHKLAMIDINFFGATSGNVTNFSTQQVKAMAEFRNNVFRGGLSYAFFGRYCNSNNFDGSANNIAISNEIESCKFAGGVERLDGIHFVNCKFWGKIYNVKIGLSMLGKTFNGVYDGTNINVNMQSADGSFWYNVPDNNGAIVTNKFI